MLGIVIKSSSVTYPTGRERKEGNGTGRDTENKDKYYVLGQLVAAVQMLAESERVFKLLPEIRSNIIMAIEGAQSTDEVAGIPGRLTEVFGKITAPAYPAWGASRNTARILLGVMNYEPSRRATMEIKYSAKTMENIRHRGISMGELSLGAGSLEKAFAACLADGKFPQVLYLADGFAREGAIILTAETATDVAALAIDIANQLD